MKVERIVYSSLVDISKANGPGVNEFEFAHALERRFGDGISFVLRRPQNPAALDGLSNVTVFGLPFGMIGGLKQLSLGFLQARSLSKHLKHAKPDLLVLRLNLLPLPIAWLLRRQETAYVLKTLGDPFLTLLTNRPRLVGLAGRILRPVHEMAYKRILNGCLISDACTPELVQLNSRALRKGNPSKIVHIENATNTDRFRPLESMDSRRRVGLAGVGRVVGYVGGEPWGRGGMQIVDAVARTLRRSRPLTGVIVGGEGPKLEELRDYASALGVGEHCRIVGQVPYDEVVYWINSFDIGIAFSPPGKLSVTGNSNQKIRQYLACGKPVITDLASHHFLEDEGIGIRVDPADTDAFLGAIDRLLNATTRSADAILRKARAYSEDHFSVDRILEKRVALWNDCRMSAPHSN